uniref:Small integral membrane protein 24 n=1 Tax=Ficedula albicollis TaxID=59894 RepID=A0A803VZD5_FICAL
MPKPLQPLSLLVLLVLAATTQGQTDTGPKVLQPWLIGLTAVVVFLFIVFLMLLVNRLWNLRRHRLDCRGGGVLARGETAWKVAVGWGRVVPGHRPASLPSQEGGRPAGDPGG